MAHTDPDTNFATDATTDTNPTTDATTDTNTATNATTDTNTATNATTDTDTNTNTNTNGTTDTNTNTNGTTDTNTNLYHHPLHPPTAVIVVICGPPGAGKTSIATRLRQALVLEYPTHTISLFHSDDYSRRTYERLYEEVRETGCDEIAIVDGTFYRRRWQTRFRSLSDVRVRFVYVTASLETCLARNRARAEADRIDEQGVHVVYREFSEPAADVRIDTDECSVSEAVERVVAAVRTWM
ncbi:hypothetical protein C500_08977 [Natrialba magadii ATCC 43099]|uniref:Uncharacterized protein n=1 Tax=Natrialba magadii (strain ATCC 43099 / DSM 3394 / CCM 3739 / CIP 104546 / IAM 13178 / JCM 8861 / NBRC 102185 / NCIMB 2190 / MS3) TaxID=547559 RepID=L9V0W3_NATMM|nr:hypothetical protein C500_08977 [Natrialba magadii ATCC 43099]